MNRHFPPFAAVRAFEAAARLGSFSQAAEELCLSPSAISHQIHHLEEYLATALFRRESGGVVLTPVGVAYLQRLTVLLGELDSATRAASGTCANGLRILTTPGFAARWLLPRLGGFEFADQVRLKVSAGAPDTDFSRNEADIVVMWGVDAVPGVVCIPLISTIRYPVASPELVKRAGLRTPLDLLNLPLIRDEVDDQWEEWFRACGVNDLHFRPSTVYPHCELASVAAEQGNGVALAYDAIIRTTLERGSLVKLFAEVTTPRVIYSIAVKEGTENHPAIKSGTDWLLECARLAGDLPQISQPSQQFAIAGE